MTVVKFLVPTVKSQAFDLDFPEIALGDGSKISRISVKGTAESESWKSRQPVLYYYFGVELAKLIKRRLEVYFHSFIQLYPNTKTKGLFKRQLLL